jgi:hypothetical protein
MFTMNNEAIYKISKQVKRAKLIANLKGIALSAVVLGFLAFSIKNVAAQETIPSTVSYGNKKLNIDDATRKNVIKSHKHNVINDQLSGRTSNKSRKEMIAEKQQQLGNSLLKRAETKSVNGLTKNYSPFADRYYAPEFSIYDAVTYLDDDYDGDGYYQTFSVVFDADVYNPNGEQNSIIYAELFISTDGENWTHYYTTDDFLITGDGNEDEFEVITTLSEGYRANEYDILIDVYEVGYSDIVASYSSYHNNSLYALPLESADYDQVYVEEVIVHGGSNSIPFLLFILFAGLVKLARSKQ